MSARLTAACAELRAYAMRDGSYDRGARDAARAKAWALAGVESAPTGEPWRVVNADGARAKVYIYDYIDPWGVNALDVVAALNELDASAIDLHINSPGGDVWEASAIYEALRSHAATVTVHVDGVAASAASFIAMVGDEIEIAKPARMMIHDAAGAIRGNATDMRAMADVLDQISADIADLYAGRAGGTAEQWREAMQANAGWGTWYNAAQAVEVGLADRIAGDTGSPVPAPAETGTQPDNKTSRAGGLRASTARLRARVA